MAKLVAPVWASGWLTFAAVIIGTYSQEALPVHYLLRPLAVTGAVALLMAVIATIIGGRSRTNLVVVAALLFALPNWWPGITLAASVALMLSIISRSRGAQVPIKSSWALTIVVLSLLISGPRVAINVAQELQAESSASITLTVPAYLIMLDGYPRGDTLARIDIDNSAFLDSLDQRGFDTYGDASSSHGWTHRTLAAFLHGSDAEVSNASIPSIEEKRAARTALVAPSTFEIIDPPVGHVVLMGGSHHSAGGMNDFEIHLIGESVLGTVFPGWTGEWIAESLRSHFEGSLQLAARVNGRQVFVHLMAPHPPFVFGAGMHECWPKCNAFDNVVENLGITPARWSELMQPHLAEVNKRVLRAVDQLIERHPGAVIVLFSDHGARITYGDRAEWHRSFLASRTPGHSRLLAGTPRPDEILRVLRSTYGVEGAVPSP